VGIAAAAESMGGIVKPERARQFVVIAVTAADAEGPAAAQSLIGIDLGGSADW